MLTGESFNDGLALMNTKAQKSWRSFLAHNRLDLASMSDAETRHVYEQWLLFRWPIDRDQNQQALDATREAEATVT